jgi:hypothetical protein
MNNLLAHPILVKDVDHDKCGFLRAEVTVAAAFRN